MMSPESQQLSPSDVQTRAERARRRTERNMYKRWGVHPWLTHAPHLQLPIWLSMMESIRYMVDGPGGLIRWIQALTGSVNMETTAGTILVTESMSTEGALWFQNLLVADPTWILPIMLSATIVTNIRLGWNLPSHEAIAEMLPKQARRQLAIRGLRAGLQIAACALCPTMIRAEVPAGLLVYWISSTLFATIQTQVLLKYKPPPPVASCHPKDVGFHKPTQLQETDQNPKTA
ncbi:hypothetical protein FQN54_009508 [Arachnomyces sp. PD_36]|nr:hypothetical protein FQN54_009508 [Arachnomyces sp. PD_36]